MEPDFWSRPFDWGRIEGKRLLVLGIGGGCDIVSAYALASLIPRDGGRKVFLGNTKSGNRFKAGLEAVSAHISKLPPEGTRVEAQEGGWQFGTAKIDLRIPRGDDGATYLIKAPKKPEEYAQAADEIRALGIDFVLAVDTGGDVLKPVGDKPGRDQRMWGIIQRTGLPSMLAVVAPGVDGETSHEEMKGLLKARLDTGALLGAIPLESLIPIFDQLKTSYGKNRTPNLILRAWKQELPGPLPGLVTIPRHEKPAYPREWMFRAVVFSG